MAKLFLFGIGGTGSRVIRSLTMLLASGVELPNCDRVVPIIIDPDAHNGDMNRTVALLQSYQQVHRRLGQQEEGFFKTDISTLSNISADANGGVKDTFIFDFGGINQSFRQYLHYDQLSVDSKAMVELLFTQDNLESPLTIGFRGSPNVGSVVLNKVVESPEMRFFADNFQEGDRVFFVSSIFGGTGAAGFPLLLKNLKDPNTRLSNARYLRDALTGAVTVMPYFALQSEENQVIDSNNFLTKTKAALSYYEHNLPGLDALYYLADTPDTPYDNQPGGTQQKNKAHLIELLAALSIVDFMQYSDAELRSGAPQLPRVRPGWRLNGGAVWPLARRNPRAGSQAPHPDAVLLALPQAAPAHRQGALPRQPEAGLCPAQRAHLPGVEQPAAQPRVRHRPVAAGTLPKPPRLPPLRLEHG
ncbi:hypothetical protein LRS06_08625 [Hymenobacter sp. J193]|uniref:hypothetical protein n=1 Tax=Hymenobacter sp. J193 TaxID=2898429 RepID=UPI0021509FCB|nr:hypothetical protein [Hymenobacter sp. J193]MCR5887841.1 hypothetical protein [Hymenobacter sp. J193]